LHISKISIILWWTRFNRYRLDCYWTIVLSYKKLKHYIKLVLSKQIDTQKWPLLVLYLLMSSLWLDLVKEWF